jgi:hypothetical protein
VDIGDSPTINLNAAGTTGCAGCHGRLEDSAADIGAGLRAHHTIAGAPPDPSGLTCAACHGGDPTPVGEHVLPPFYAALSLDACADNLDNDGDDLYDGSDPNCVANEPPVADANGPYTGTVGVAVLFDGSGSTDPEGGALTYDWDFGDGGTGTGVNPTHAYTAPGT